MVPKNLQILILVLALVSFAKKKMLKLLDAKLLILWEDDTTIIYVPTAWKSTMLFPSKSNAQTKLNFIEQTDFIFPVESVLF